MTTQSHWERFVRYHLRDAATGLQIDVSRMQFDEDLFNSMGERIARAQRIMREVEAGAIANPDENRMVGHYWLREPALAPTEEIRAAIVQTNQSIKHFAAEIHAGTLAAPGGRLFKRVLLIGIGGSALGPQFVADALAGINPPMAIDFLDNTDPEGIAQILGRIGTHGLGETLVLVISKSGGTKETRNGMLETAAFYKSAGLDFAKHAVAITGTGSELDNLASREGWIARFPMWDWVGGRTSVMSAVGLVPMALLGIHVDDFLDGAAKMDVWTRMDDPRKNPALLLALMWYRVGHGHGQKDMVILPYRDKLGLFSKYLQQLVMESLGKEKDLDGRTVHQGIAVYGNKGSTDQHAYVQQLRDGVNNFFVTFIEVAKSHSGTPVQVEPGVTSGDYLQGFLRGTRAALAEKERESITITLPDVSAFHVGALIALYERAVGFYAGLINVNAYHQPGVEAGKKAATKLLELQKLLTSRLRKGVGQTAEALASQVEADPEEVYHILRHLAATDRAVLNQGATPRDDLFAGV